MINPINNQLYEKISRQKKKGGEEENMKLTS